MPQQTYNWKRFWCPRERNFSLADYGYLYDPDTEYGKHINPDVVSFERIADIPCLILLGEPGIGKSSALQTEKDDISAKIEQQGHKSLPLNLRSFGSEDRLIRSLFEHETFKSWKDSSHRLYLFLDSFDECLLRIDTLSTLLADELSNHSSQIQRLYLRIASRTADWSLALENRFINLWGKDAVRAYKLAPLRRKDVEEAANAENIETESFVEAIRQNEAVPLAIKPITLGFLLGIYKSKGGFPERKIDLYLDGCLEICKEPPESNRREAKLLGNLDPEIRLAIAGRIAALTIFCNRSAVLQNWGQEQLLPEDITFREIWGGEEIVKKINYPVNEKAIEEVIGTGLFSDCGDNRLGFAHQTYAEFLAAWYVAEHRNLPLVQIMSLLITPEDPEKRLVPQLHETAAWIASMRHDVLKEITQTDPDVILRSDIPTDTSFKERLVENLLSRNEQGLGITSDERINNYKYLKKLKHPNLANQIKSYIQDCSKSLRTRCFAIDIAEVCEEKSLQDFLVEIALSSSEDIYIRQSAAQALTLIADSNVKMRLKRLAINEMLEDEDDSLKGYSLIAVWSGHLTDDWSEHLSAEELFQILTPPKKANYYGGYNRFLDTEIVKHLKPSDLPIALNWVVRQGDRHFQHPFDSSANAIIRFAWDYIEDPLVLKLLAQIALIQWKEYQVVITDDRDISFEELLLTSDSKRRLLIEAIVLILAEENQDLPHYIARLVREINILSRDFIWLISKAKVSTSSKIKNIWINLVQWSFNNREVAQIDALCITTQEDSTFHDRFGGWFKSIEFGSDEADSEITRYQEIQESAKLRESNKKSKLSDEEIKGKINYYLDEFDAGKLDAWWLLNRAITLNPNSPYYGSNLNIDLTDCYGWQSADPATKTRIINAAKEYVKLQNSCSNDWIGTNTYNLASLAGCRALYLLLKDEPLFLNHISTDVWTKWTPAIVAFPHGSGVRENTNLELLKLAYFHAPIEFINTFLQLIDADNKCSSYLSRIDKLEMCWDERLKNALLDKVKVLDLQPKCISQLLEELIKVDHEQSRDFAKSLLSWSGDDDRQRAIFVAQVLLKQAQESDWDIIWHTITKDLDFAKESLEEMASYELRNLTLSLNEKQLADLYIWLESTYPHIEDSVHDTWHSEESRENVARFRDGVLTQLRETGTLKACQEIQRIIQHFSDYDLKWHLIKAQNALRKKSWKPPEPKELMQLVNNSNKRLIQDGNQLLDVIIEALDKKFHDQTSSAIDLWNEVKWGQIRHLADSLSKHLKNASSFSDLFKVDWRTVPKTKDNTYLPKEEERVSDYIARYLRDFLCDRAILSNREVVIRDQDRVDILVEIAVENEKIEVYDRIAVIIEAKGCWNSGLNSAMETQLVNRYLKKNSCQFGLYLIAWFNCSKWDDSDTRKTASQKISLEQAREQFVKQAESLSQGGVTVKSFVLDASLR